MKIYYYIVFFIMGTIFGSFYNVLGTRIPKGESIVKPGSHCEYCNHELSWYELIPILSYIFLKGECKNCHHKLSLLYPFTEIACGLLFLVSYHSFGFKLDLLISLILVSTFIIIIVSDLNYLIIPDRFIIIPSILIIIIDLFQIGVIDTLIQIGYGILGFILMYLIMLLGNRLFKKESLGGADIKLMFLIGLVLDPMLTIVVLFLASFIALIPSIYLLLKNKEHIVPYGPFLMIGLLIVYFTKLNIIEIFEKILKIF